MGRHTPTEYGDVDFDQTPVTSVDIIPGDIFRVREVNERVEPNSRSEDDEYAHREHGDYHDLLFEAHVQSCKVPQWQDHDNKIQNNVDGSRDPTLEVDIVTFASMKTVPIVPGHADGCTLEGRCKEERDCVGERYTHYGVHLHTEIFGWEDTEVRKQNRDLGDAEGHNVENLSVVEVSQKASDLFGSQCPQVSPQSILDHYLDVSNLHTQSMCFCDLQK